MYEKSRRKARKALRKARKALRKALRKAAPMCFFHTILYLEGALQGAPRRRRSTVFFVCLLFAGGFVVARRWYRMASRRVL